MKRYWEKPAVRKNNKGWSQDKFYQSKLWRHVRNPFMKYHPLCLYCKYQKRYKSSTVCDHIVPRRLGGCDICTENLQSLCTSCHNTKSAYESNNDVDPITREIYKIKYLGDAVRPEAQKQAQSIYEGYVYQDDESA